MSVEQSTKRRRLDQSLCLQIRDPEAAVDLPTFDNVLPDAHTHGTLELETIRLQTPSPICQICQLDLLPMFAQDTSEISAGRLSKYMRHSCPFANIIQEVMRLRCDSSWATGIISSDIDSGPDLLLKSRGWVFAQIPGKVNRYGKVIRQVKNHFPRVILAIDERPPGVDSTQTRKKLVDSLKTPYIIAELELVDKVSADESGVSQELSSPSRRRVEKYFDCNQAFQWLERCKDHKACKKDENLFQKALFWQHPGFRLIDIHQQCLVQQTEPCSYVALSYVWGKSAESSLRTEKSNVDVLSAVGALDLNDPLKHTGREVSRTVRDAMQLAQRLKYRFLWVDALCIVQNDPEEKKRLIHGMDRIYEHASLTIICAAGMDADAGLCGISPRETLLYNSEFTLVSEEHTSYKVAISRPSLVHQIRECHWNKRGWTYQEHCLSQRCLYFSTDEVFFSCKQAQWREGYDLEQFPSQKVENISFRTGPPWWSHRIQKDPDPSPHQCLIGNSRRLTFEKYQMVVQEYCRRKLSHPKDILNAFQGIFNRFCGLPASENRWAGHAQGIPPRFLPQALLWYPLKGTTKRACDLEGGGLDEEFSSWSWASWSGPVDFVYSRNSGLDSTWDSQGFTMGNNIRSLIVDWHFPPPVSSAWNQAQVPKQDQMALLREEFHSDFEAIEKLRTSLPIPDTGLPNGVMEFSAPVLLSKLKASHWKENLFNLDIDVSPSYRWSHRSEATRGRFRFDRPKENVEIEDLTFVAIMMSPGVISVIGAARKDEITFVRAGVGSIFYPGRYSPDNIALCNTLVTGKRNPTRWEIRLVRIC
jgi:Heterokaryon incompatibility protein (HET)